MRSKVRRRIGIGVAVVLAVAVAVILLVPVLVPAERVRELIVAQLEKATGADVQLGEAQVRIWPRVRVGLADGSMEGTGDVRAAAARGAPALERYRVAVERLEVDVALLPLLRKRVEIGSIRLVQPRAEVTTRAALEAATDDVAAAPTDRAPATGAPSGGAGGELAGFGLALAALEIEDGNLVWTETGAERFVVAAGWYQKTRASDLDALLRLLSQNRNGTELADLAASQLSIEGRIAELTLGLPAAGEKPNPVRLADLRYAAELTVPAAADRIELNDVTLSWNPWDLRCEAVLRPDSVSAGWRVPHFTATSADGKLRLAGRLATGPGGVTGELDGQVELATLWPALATTLRSLGRAEQAEALPSVPGEVQGSIALGDGIAVKSFRATLKPWDLQGSLRWRALPEGAGWRADSIDVATVDESTRITGQIQQGDGGTTGRLAGNTDLERIWPRLRETLVALGRPGLADSLPDMTGKVTMELELREFTGRQFGGYHELLAAWRKAGAGALRLTASGRDLGIRDRIPGAPWRAAAVELTGTSPRPLAVSVRDLQHDALQGEAELAIAPVSTSAWPDYDLVARLERLDLDLLRAALAPRVAAAGDVAPSLAGDAGYARAGQRRDAMAWLGRLVPAAHAQPATALQVAASPNGSAAAATVPTLLVAGAAAAATAAEVRTFGESLPAELRMHYRGRASRVRFNAVDYTDLQLEGRLANQIFTVDTLSAHRGGGVLAGHAVVDYARDPWGHLEFRGEVKQVQTAALLAPYLPKFAPHWEGAVSGPVAGSLRLVADKPAMLASLDLSGRIESQDGVYHAQDLLVGVAPFLGARQDLQDIRFHDLIQSFAVNGGRFEVKDLRVDGLDTDWTGAGWIGLDGGIDLNLTVKLPQGFTPDLGQASALADALRGDDGRIKLDLNLTGRAASPTVALDLAAAKAKIEQQLQNSVKDEVKDKLGGLLDKLKGR